MSDQNPNFADMNEQAQLNYARIAAAIEYISINFQKQPDLDEIARHVHVSPAHFQKLFIDWAGVSPKKFLQFISLDYAKHLLRNHQSANLFDVTYQTGLSSTSRLHDLFVKIEGMTPAEYKYGGKDLSIQYANYDSPFGKLLVANTAKGICYLSFLEANDNGMNALTNQFPNAHFIHNQNEVNAAALKVFEVGREQNEQIKLHIKGTPFQMKIWEALLRIPLGQVSTYGEIAHSVGQSGASRAVGTAIGSNPVAFLIPCHRVIRSTGAIGGYMWGTTRKLAIRGWESASMHE